MGRDSLGEFEQFVLLALICRRPNAYGVSIVREIERRTGRPVSYGAVYTTLDRLTDKGFVTSRMGEPTAERGGRRKRLYDITAAGSRALEAADAQRARMREGIEGLPHPAFVAGNA